MRGPSKYYQTYFLLKLYYVWEDGRRRDKPGRWRSARTRTKEDPNALRRRRRRRTAAGGARVRRGRAAARARSREVGEAHRVVVLEHPRSFPPGLLPAVSGVVAPAPAARERRLLRIGRALRPHRRGTAARSDRGGVREARRSRARSRPGTELPRRALPSARTRACGAEPARACRE